jgi:hypothetical protein
MSTTLADLERAVDQRISITATARDAKAAAVLMVPGRMVYVQGLARWPESRLGKTVTVAGTLRRARIFPDVTDAEGRAQQGMVGEQFYLEPDEKIL